ncbi:MAG: PilZ domain-containing protein [Moraxellaceae bacterium]|jgi:hypothetical protein|nr:MAG: PilZ domain-containing protein [Moraxellaceae bacterium]
METSSERRQFTRVGFAAGAELIQEGNLVHADLIDISLNGILVRTPEQYEFRTDIPCSVQIHLSDDTVIQMQVALVHSSSQCLGFHCTSIDMDSIIHLRRLIEINLNDPSAAERVLAELVRQEKYPLE